MAGCVALALWQGGNSNAGSASAAQLERGQTATYNNYREPRVPWSIHVVRIPRSSGIFEIQTVHARGRAIGLDPVTDQIRTINAARGEPIAALNGDFYERRGEFAGDPRGLQIVEGELISAPAGGASVWIDLLGGPHLGEISSELQVSWPDGATSPIGLNGYRSSNEIQLYTPSVGHSTQTRRGSELILERKADYRWLPLRPGRLYRGIVREIRDGGNAPLQEGTMVLSIGPGLIPSLPAVQVGSEITISTVTQPSLRLAKSAISGGPALVRDGKPERIQIPHSYSYEFRSMRERHPRSAVGWNDDFFFFVQIEGRRRGVSVGMTLNELASYMIQLGCREAMNFDGGGSATLWYNGKVRNYLCDGFERDVANSVVAVKKPRIP